MKVYYNSGNDDFTRKEFESYMLKNRLRIDLGEIEKIRILERGFFGNSGHALDARIKNSDGLYHIMNIGRNPIGTGPINYIPFLEEMGCKKIAGIYRLESLVGENIITLYRGNNSNGHIVPKSFMDLYKD